MLNIIADDLGLHKSINDGIILGLKKGFINGASLMPIGKEFGDALSKIRNLNNPKIGIHFVLVDEKPLALEVLPKNHEIFFIRYIFGLIRLKDIERELKAQLDKCIQAGIKPVFINSHQHLHLLPGVMDIVVKLAKEHGISYIRIVNEPLSLSGGKIFRQIQLMFLNFLSKFAKNKIKKAGLKCNDSFIGFLSAGHLKKKDLDIARNLSEIGKIVELGCHPGFEDEDLRKKYQHWPDYHWLKELELLQNG